MSEDKPSLEVEVPWPLDHEHRRWTQSASQWNRRHVVGCAVRYWSVSGRPVAYETATRSLAWELPSGDGVVMLIGFTGGIALDHIEVIGPTPHSLGMDPDLPDTAGPRLRALSRIYQSRGAVRDQGDRWRLHLERRDAAIALDLRGAMAMLHSKSLDAALGSSKRSRVCITAEAAAVLGDLLDQRLQELGDDSLGEVS